MSCSLLIHQIKSRSCKNNDTTSPRNHGNDAAIDTIALLSSYREMHSMERSHGDHHPISNPFVGSSGNNNNNTNNNNNNCSILACSAMLSPKRPLLADRKKPLDHLKPRPLTLSVIRTIVQQGGIFLGNFLSDQLEYESKTEELVQRGELTQDEADRNNEHWETNEWSQRIHALPQKIMIAFGKLQSATLFMRVYEHLASKLVSDKVLDKLTKDLFQSSKRKTKRFEERRHVGTQMVSTCLWGNAIGFLSDYTVQQLILCGGFWVFVAKRRNDAAKKRKALEYLPRVKEEEETKGGGGLALSFVVKSCRLAVTRTTAWAVSSGTGAMGTMVYPGYGTLIGIQLGDTLVSSLME